jgi:hypothetical protein
VGNNERIKKKKAGKRYGVTYLQTSTGKRLLQLLDPLALLPIASKHLFLLFQHFLISAHRITWINAESPMINRMPWTKDEDTKLVKMAKKYHGFHWEAVAKELGVCVSSFFLTSSESVLQNLIIYFRLVELQCNVCVDTNAISIQT